jgi:hypothetical protein
LRSEYFDNMRQVCFEIFIEELQVRNGIEGCRQAALDILKPTSKQLRHALELHEDALVRDAYGFSPFGINDYSRVDKLLDENTTPDELTLAKEEGNSVERMILRLARFTA